jgi:hypothetical protein
LDLDSLYQPQNLKSIPKERTRSSAIDKPFCILLKTLIPPSLTKEVDVKSLSKNCPLTLISIANLFSRQLLNPPMKSDRFSLSQNEPWLSIE